MTERQKYIAECRTILDTLRKDINLLIKEPVTPEKISGLVRVRNSLAALHADAVEVRDRQLRLDVEDQRDRVRNALGMTSLA